LKKTLYPILIILICIYSCKSQVKKQELELTAKLGGIIYLDTTSTFHIATTLYNPTNDTIDFVTMTCSYEDLFITDTSIFKVQSRYDCFSNYPEVISMPPKSKLDQFIMVRPTSKDLKLIEHTLKIGMYLMIPNEKNGFKGIINQYENRQKANILWSNELDLKRLYRRQYK
jgi:hypothetical protein